MSHSFLEFADFDGAWRYSSTPSIATAQLFPIASAGQPTLIHIRAPASRSLTFNLRQPSTSSIASRRRAQSESIPRNLQPNTIAGAERPISAILVSFTPVNWISEPHPGPPADLPRGEDNEAVSPKSRLPGPLQKAESKLRFPDPLALEEKKRIGTSVAAVKSPYPLQARSRSTRLRAWTKGLVGKLRGR